MKDFDEREEGYTRVKIPKSMLEPTSWYCLPKHRCNIWIYIPNGKNNRPGKNLYSSDKNYPILQSYIDVCVNGALLYGVNYAKEFLETTFLWNEFWLNDRELPRRPWVHQKNYKQIDELLKKFPRKNNQFINRKLPPEFSIYFSKKSNKNSKKKNRHIHLKKCSHKKISY